MTQIFASDADFLAKFKSFEAIPLSTRSYMYAGGWLEPFIYPIFAAGRFPVHYKAEGLSDASLHDSLQEIFDVRNLLNVTDCAEYNWWLKQTGRVVEVPHRLTTICQKKSGEPALCKNFKKFSCKGCGRVFIPGSLNDPACVVHPNPWWYDFLKDQISDWLDEHGGVSKTDPLVIFYDGVYRHGRTETHNPDLSSY